MSARVFVGRSAELSKLREAYGLAANGRSISVLVSGDAGVGKTRLVSEFTAWASGLDSIVTVGRAVPASEGGLVYGAVADAFRRLAQETESSGRTRDIASARAELSRIVPELTTENAGTRTAGSAGRTGLFESVLRLLGHLARRRPAVLVLEDLHWADRATLELFGFLVRNLEHERVLLVATLRTDEPADAVGVRAFLAELERSGRLQRLELEPFNASDARLHIKAILGRDADPAVVARVIDRSAGNPLFAEELLALDRPGEQRSLPATVRDTFLARLMVLSSEARTVLRAASVVGRDVDEALLRALTPLDDARRTEGLREAVDHGVLLILRDNLGERYSFRHPLLRDAIYERLLIEERRSLHASAAQELQSRIRADAPPAIWGELADHWQAAGRRREALAAAIDAAEVAERALAFADAAQLWRRAFELWDYADHDEARAASQPLDLAEAAARSAARAGDDRTAIDLLTRALALPAASADPRRRGVLLLELALRLAEIGDSPGSRRALDHARQLLAGDESPSTRARVLLLEARFLVVSSQHDAAAEVADRAHALAAAGGALREAAEALHWHAVAETFRGGVDRALADAAESRRIALVVGDPAPLIRSFHTEGFVLQAALRLAEAADVYLEGVRVAERYGDLASMTVWSEAAAECLRRIGRWHEAERLTRAVVERIAGHAIFTVHLVRALILAGMGEFDEAERHATAGWDRLQGPVAETDVNGKYFGARAEVAVWRRDVERGRAWIDAGLERLSGTGDVRWVGQLTTLGVRLEADAAAVARRRGNAVRLEEARRRGADALAGMHAVGRPDGLRWPIFRQEVEGPTLLCEAEFARLEGHFDVGLWDRAARAWSAVGQPYPVAYALYREAEAVLRTGGSRREAHRILGDARGRALELGARPLLEEIDALGRRAHLSLFATGSADGPVNGAGDLSEHRLTRREREVLELLARGASDREIGETLFISPKTASVHVLNVKSKLGVRTRLEAARIASRRERDRGAPSTLK